MANSGKSFCSLEESSGDRLVTTISGITFGMSLNKRDCSDGVSSFRFWFMYSKSVWKYG